MNNYEGYIKVVDGNKTKKEKQKRTTNRFKATER